MKYTTLLFDNDDTIMDFLAAERQGIKKTFEDNGVPFSEEILAVYSATNDRFWKMLERGEITRDEVYIGRFYSFREQTGFDFDAEKVSADYMVNLADGHELLPGAEDLIKSLYGKYKIYIATNGHKDVQHRRIKECGLEKYYDGVFISEEIGAKKPDKAYFDYVLEHIEEKDKSKILLIGDSMSSDILGGMRAGIDTLWFNHRHREALAGVVPTYEADNIEDIYKCL